MLNNEDDAPWTEHDDHDSEQKYWPDFTQVNVGSHKEYGKCVDYYGDQDQDDLQHADLRSLAQVKIWF